MPDVLRRLLPLTLLALLAACAGRPGPDLLRPDTVAASGAKVVTLYVATTRQRKADGSFTAGRAMETSYLRFRISIPPRHKPGNIEWPKAKPNPKTDFVTVEQALLDEKSFERDVSAPRGGKPPSIGVFVHGFNTNLTEAVYRAAQMASDSSADAVPILFAWPSEGAITGYVADKDAVTFSRDELVELMTMLAGKRTEGPIGLVGHSMGGWLTAEAVRQLRITGRNDVIARLQVILAAPDIDVDVFRSQVAAIGPLSPPMTVLVSTDDVALRVSEFLSTDRQRLGRIDVTDPRVEEAVAKAKIRVVDISELDTADGLGHDRFVTFAALYPKISQAAGQSADLRQAGAFVFNAVGTTLSSPFLLAGKIVGGQ